MPRGVQETVRRVQEQLLEIAFEWQAVQGMDESSEKAALQRAFIQKLKEPCSTIHRIENEFHWTVQQIELIIEKMAFERDSQRKIEELRDILFQIQLEHVQLNRVRNACVKLHASLQK